MIATRNWLIVGCAVLAAAMFACGDDDDGGSATGSVCDQACKKLTDCNPNGVTECNISCPQHQSVAECIVNASCDQTLNCMMGGGNGGSAGAAGSSNAGTCTELAQRCASCTDASVKTQCESVAASNQDGACQAVLASPQFPQVCP